MSRRRRDDDPEASSGDERGPDFKALYRKLERALVEIERTEDVAATLEAILQALIAGFREELGITGGRIYRREGADFFLCCGFGSSLGAPVGVRVPRDYPPHLQTLDEGLLIMRPGEPGYDEVFERSVGVASTFAAISVGRDKRFVVAFSIDGAPREERLLYSLTAVRHVINLKLEQQRFAGMLREARAIQESMLPRAPAVLSGFEIAGTTRAAATVGGDLYDYLPLSDRTVGVAIADATGHGFPAALIARDAITGLRTLATEKTSAAATVARLNGVIHRAALTGKFVSMFYARFSADGRVAYCNAGHNPPLLVRSRSIATLETGGPVLGPLPRARYDDDRTRLASGDTIVMYTDGIPERTDPHGEMFGMDRLREVVRAAAGAAPAELIEEIYVATEIHAAGRPQDDDMTVVVVRRT